ncbi:magnesium transporter [Arcicella aquatica]|uniref:Magnesium transporter MgtE n=1 Tax=Arcicella aquatica TaxID=217141 RepID=A0ABU5QNG9_9BACT|nr:magnesium transporter [Arcicella aquatica]MEA5258264.1 magnesium transporter [Arcicella aquatica]
MESTNQQPFELTPFELTKEYLEKIQTAISVQENELIIAEMGELYPADITNILYELNGEESHYLVKLLDKKLGAEIITNLDADDRKKFLKNFTAKEIAEYIDVLDSDDAVDILNEQPKDISEDIIGLLKDREQARFVNDLMHYDEDSAGGLMQKELIKINIKQSITECIEEIRRQAEDVENVSAVYVVDDESILLGRVSLKRIILAKRGAKVSDIYDEDIVSVKTTAKGEEVADVMQKYDLDAVPVVNIQGRLLGRITIDDVVDFITESAQEDVQAMTGISEDVEEDDSVWRLVRSRLPWLLGGMVGSFFAARLIHNFEDLLSKIPAVAFFIPLIGSTGGNVGVQSSSIIVQSLADKSGIDVSLGERLLKVLKVAFFNAIIAGIFAFFGSLIVDSVNVQLSITVSLSIFSVVLLASFMGTITPLVLNKFNINPAIASGPFITTTNDLLGYGVYLLIVYILM